MLVTNIIAFNILVFLAWFFASGRPDAFATLVENFTVSWTGLIQGRVWILLTSVFSHNAFFHLMINMYVLRGFGEFLERLLGTRRFLSFYLIAGVSGSVAHALVSAFLIGEPGLPALGASGAIAGIILFFSLTFPQEKLLLLGLIPVRAGWAALLIIALDLWGLSVQTRGGGLPIGHGAHLGGALIGILYFLLRRARA
jgi:membrane associated rhomboid family serine protease